MIFRHSEASPSRYIAEFAGHIQGQLNEDILEIPPRLGDGYIRHLNFAADFQVTVHHYRFNEDLTILREASTLDCRHVNAFFFCNDHSLAIAFDDGPDLAFSSHEGPAIHLSSIDVSSAIRFPANTPVHYLVVTLEGRRLRGLTNVDIPNSIIQTVAGTTNSFLFLEEMNPEIRLLLKNLMTIDMMDPFSYFYWQIKVQELLYMVFRSLSSRDSAGYQAINSADTKRLMAIRKEILRDLSVPPVLSKLAKFGAMSESKLKQLFKQTFGKTVYSFYQEARMKEAAFLLKYGKHSVAEVGYEMGFSNLSHFSKIFEKHYGQNPKRYSYS